MVRAARTTRPPTEAMATNAVLPGLPETDSLLTSETREADVVTSIAPIVVGELGAFDGTSLALGGADLTGAELTATGLVGAAVGRTGKLTGIDMDIDMLIDMEKKRRPSSSARARKRLNQKQKSRKLGQVSSIIVQQIIYCMSVAYISVSAISLSRPD